MDRSLHHKKLSFKKLELSSNSLFHCWIGALKLSLLLKLYPIKLDLDSNYIISSSEVELYLCKSTIQCYQCYNVTCLCWFSYLVLGCTGEAARHGQEYIGTCAGHLSPFLSWNKLKQDKMVANTFCYRFIENVRDFQICLKMFCLRLSCISRLSSGQLLI